MNALFALVLVLLFAVTKAFCEELQPIVAVATVGTASFYGDLYRGRIMANGSPFDPDAMTCATWEWPLGSVLRVSYKNPKFTTIFAVQVTVTDRGPARSLHRVIDLSQGAFVRLATLRDGIIPVRIELVKIGGAP